MKRFIYSITILILFVGTPATYVNAQTNTDPTTRDMFYLVVFEPGPEWLEGKPVGEQNLGDHGRYLMERYAEGQLQQAGPFTDNTGGAILYRAENLDEAKKWVAADPAVKTGIMVATVSPWRWVEWDYHQDRAALNRLNSQFIENFINGDVVALKKILHPDYVYINGDGTISNRADYMGKHATAYTDGRYTSFSNSDVDIRFFGNMALVRSKTVHTKNEYGETVQGNALFNHTYIKEDGKWLCVQAHITPVAPK